MKQQVDEPHTPAICVVELPPMFTSKPHGEQRVYLVEDAKTFSQRIYELHDSRGNATPLLGSELDSLVEWWKLERARQA